jgi:ribonuclease D
MDIRLSWSDLPENYPEGSSVAIDTETMGLNTRRDRLCVVQCGWSDGTVHLVQIKPDTPSDAPHLKRLLANPRVEKIFHFARFDMAALYHRFGVMPSPVYCTKIASKLARTYTDNHGLKTLCRELLGAEISKGEQSSDWGADVLSDDQKRYAAKDVFYLHNIRNKLDHMLVREHRRELAEGAFEFLPTLVKLDLQGWDERLLAHL